MVSVFMIQKCILKSVRKTKLISNINDNCFIIALKTKFNVTHCSDIYSLFYNVITKIKIYLIINLIIINNICKILQINK